MFIQLATTSGHKPSDRIGKIIEVAPYRRKDLIRLLVEGAEIPENQLNLELKGSPLVVEAIKRDLEESDDASRSETSAWKMAPRANVSESGYM